MRIVTVYFDYEDHRDYDILSKAFENSCKIHMPKASFERVKIEAPTVGGGMPRFAHSNSFKFSKWAEIMEESKVNTVFCDSDMVANGNIFDLFDQEEFDIALTVRTGAQVIEVNERIPKPGTISYLKYIKEKRQKSRAIKALAWKPPLYNGGAVYARPTEGARRFFRMWHDADQKLFHDHDLWEKWHNKYTGMNQASLGYMMEELKPNAKIILVPCRFWNACNNDWAKVNEQSRLIHCKGPLRKAILGQGPIQESFAHILGLWGRYA